MAGYLPVVSLIVCAVVRISTGFLLPNYPMNNMLQPMPGYQGYQPMQPMQPLPGMNAYPPMTFDFAGMNQPSNPNFPNLQFPQIYVPSIQIPNKPGTSVVNNSASAQGQNGAGSGVSTGAQASGQGVQVGGSASSSGSGSSSGGYQSSSSGTSFISGGGKKAYSEPYNAINYGPAYLGQITAWMPNGYY